MNARNGIAEPKIKKISTFEKSFELFFEGHVIQDSISDFSFIKRNLIELLGVNGLLKLAKVTMKMRKIIALEQQWSRIFSKEPMRF